MDKKSLAGGIAKIINDIVTERCRQIQKEGWTPEHDDKHVAGELARAAAYYALASAATHFYIGAIFQNRFTYSRLIHAADVAWPFDPRQRKPKDRRADLIRAGALIVAEIERVDRMEEDK